MEELLAASPEVYVSKVRRELNGFARGESKYRGVTRRSKVGRWEARISGIFDKKVRVAPPSRHPRNR